LPLVLGWPLLLAGWALLGWALLLGWLLLGWALLLGWLLLG
jgi:hypothetical protein